MSDPIEVFQIMAATTALLAGIALSLWAGCEISIRARRTRKRKDAFVWAAVAQAAREATILVIEEELEKSNGERRFPITQNPGRTRCERLG